MDLLRRTAMQEDMVQYDLFLVQPNLSDTQADELCLQHLVEEILAKVAPLLTRHIWQQQPFNLKYHTEKGGVPAHIGGCTVFGDSVDDEWFIVYLLLQITQAFPELAARLEDNDGEFLLIEAADYLPKWLNPESSENRVFLHRGELYILPCPSRSGDVGLPRDAVPSVTQALALLSSHTQACLASPKIRTALGKRLAGYPEKIQANLHHAHCFLPAGIATVLAQRPDLVAPAVSAFYLRDPVDLQACRTFRTFPADTRVLTSVTFTRCLYAQMQQQHFTPDQRSGFTLPARSHPQYRAHELGMKLAHGFEILCSKCRQPSSVPDAPISCNPLWKGFLNSLKKNGYFRGELEGSAHYRELMTSAENFFKQSITPTHSSGGRAPAEEVLQLLQSCAPYNLDELSKREAHLPPEDSEGWLDISAQELEHLLEGSGVGLGGSEPSLTKHTQGGRSEKGEEEGSYSMVAVTQGMKNFINAMSSHEGAELPWSHSNELFRFDPESMAGALDRLLGAKDEELDSDDLDDEDDDEDDRVKGPTGPLGVGPEALEDLRKYMDEMDHELMGTNIGQSFNQQDTSKAGQEDLLGGDEEEIQPLNIDLNLVTNLLESLSSQAGLAGPASNLLHSLGIHLPPNTDRS
uniref:protein ecdysoneless homolog n=1 Tax=Oncorhynchus gorbuscha TaxID=8017 RepID=UPI001EAE92F3|nr:protein ecdysoneless homolog [Oncorhynchus gorbuscha]XP_046209909.1 protein ecdysoneless homolog [Oncorhynchus gorbuscha]